ncbi:MAG: STAS domain-containing protein [Candidatus Latescibacterota bacterium]
MLRVTVVEQTLDRVVLKVEGWVCRANLSLLEQEGAPWMSPAHRVVLDLDGVQFIDEAGAALVRHWMGQGAVARGGSAFVQMMLESPEPG